MTRTEAEFCIDAMELGYSFATAQKMSRLVEPTAIKTYWDLIEIAHERGLTPAEVERLHRTAYEILGANYV